MVLPWEVTSKIIRSRIACFDTNLLTFQLPCSEITWPSLPPENFILVVSRKWMGDKQGAARRVNGQTNVAQGGARKGSVLETCEQSIVSKANLCITPILVYVHCSSSPILTSLFIYFRYNSWWSNISTILAYALDSLILYLPVRFSCKVLALDELSHSHLHLLQSSECWWRHPHCETIW